MNLTPEGNDNKPRSSFETGSANADVQADYTRPPEFRRREPVLGILSLIFGIVSVMANCCCMLSGIPFGIASIVLAVVDRSKNGSMSGMSIAGMICGIVGSAGVLVLFAVSVAFGVFAGLQFV